MILGYSWVNQEWESSLINAVLRVKTLARASDDHATQRDIDQELASDDSHRPILHDSQGLAGGAIENLRRAKSSSRGARKWCLKHAIWIPVSGGLVFERGMGYSSRTLPTRFQSLKDDQLVVRKKSVLARSLGSNVVGGGAKETAMEAVKVSCEKPFDAAASNRHTWTEVSMTIEFQEPIEKLINLTMNTIVDAPTKTGPKTQTATGEATGGSEQPNLGAWLFAVGQRGSPGTKISASIDVGCWRHSASVLETLVTLPESGLCLTHRFMTRALVEAEASPFSSNTSYRTMRPRDNPQATLPPRAGELFVPSKTSHPSGPGSRLWLPKEPSPTPKSHIQQGTALPRVLGGATAHRAFEDAGEPSQSSNSDPSYLEFRYNTHMPLKRVFILRLDKLAFFDH
ncbi:hypothetical protein BS47DRAFT_1484776 [Hydnum rufescens UP504]|uniref:Uncharacterized protein n=1 Tax=Hydnum rufescens UP504 TaxID=1448309 RepID=A0A9P6DXJ1_9AGAM|nr:hypothetical protein BS47DRAFT_1484776 [Hydnum rufescens UP504]